MTKEKKIQFRNAFIRFQKKWSKEGAICLGASILSEEGSLELVSGNADMGRQLAAELLVLSHKAIPGNNWEDHCKAFMTIVRDKLVESNDQVQDD